jgi:hypothetical protein
VFILSLNLNLGKRTIVSLTLLVAKIKVMFLKKLFVSTKETSGGAAKATNVP